MHQSSNMLQPSSNVSGDPDVFPKRIRNRMINKDDDILIIKRIDRKLIQVQDIFDTSANVDSRMAISKGEQNFHLLL